MGLRGMLERLGGSAALDRVADPVHASVGRALRSEPLRDALRGRWLGHPLHPMLTDAPIGFWASAVVLDFAGGDDSERAADLLLGLGLAASLPTVAAGLADWSQASRRARRQGVVHALANVLAETLFAASLLARRSDRRAGRLLAGLGAGCLAAGGYIGAHMAYVEGVGVAGRAAREPAAPVGDGGDLTGRRTQPGT